ncbi:DoxX family protein [Dermatobacter hominis]|uniref:DoxX family protein n=1 Tax=Dermatobacter hominis TaxID=2884263 RepID=UPI001D124FB2|nr:DoxX family protein [Dermatobacter hominis]UDY34280.1 DoxX family protein [Dermatobacter hominis]
MTYISASEFDVILLVLRVVAGVTLFLHGYNKVFRGGKIDGTAGWFESLGMKPGRLNAYMAATTELGAGALLTVGLLTPLAAAGLIGICVVAARTDHRGSFFMFKNGWEYVMVLGFLGWGIGALGPGRWSLDHAFGIADELTKDWRGAIIAGVVGVLAGAGTLLAFHHPTPSSDS